MKKCDYCGQPLAPCPSCGDADCRERNPEGTASLRLAGYAAPRDPSALVHASDVGLDACVVRSLRRLLRCAAEEPGQTPALAEAVRGAGK